MSKRHSLDGLQERGQRLRSDLVARDPDLDRAGNPMAEVMLSACRTADRVERLEREAADAPSWITTDKGALMTHPVQVEVRQQAILLARLLAALRLPDEAGKRPQARSLRGVHGPGKVSSIERARLRAEGQEGA
ncbi:hypothetical protein [Nocardioides sp. CFH 31398]|uniref:hypothetical protein n=1 Tax=Nocardioides sp. CFH 31398 TaxID=2919579 RepID=UPI001F057DCF|nr:hypothetical protein [Nocardioides sp. CFH 31398]MCH1867085.1 hypothetical protein [Nocardioides sp. CFH 31398]